MYHDGLWGASERVARTSSAVVYSLGWGGITLFFLLFQLSLVGSVSLLIVGVSLWDPRIVLAGLMSLRLFAFLHAVGRELFTST